MVSGVGVLGWLLAITLASVMTVRGSVRFDVNEWLKEKRRIKKERMDKLIKETCPHMLILNGKPSSQFIQQGDLTWRCDGCGAIMDDGDSVQKSVDYWISHPKEYAKAFEKRNKLIRQYNRL